MLHSRSVPSACVRLVIGTVMAMLASAPVTAQGASGDPMAFPRQVLTWYLGGEGARVWEVAAGPLRELAGNAEELEDAAAEIVASMGQQTAMLDEQVFDHPDGDGAQVYVRATRHEHVPEIFWIVTFSPSDRKVLMIMPQPRQTVRALFPQIRLPEGGT